jgi:uncharacterized protein (DUF1800 family)
MALHKETMTSLTNQQKISHLLWRAGFGPQPQVLSKEGNKSYKTVVNKLFKEAELNKPLQVVSSDAVAQVKMKDMSPEAKKEMRQESKDELRNLNVAWLSRMGNGEAVLREKMTLFWHGHFACRTKNAYFAQEQNNKIRTHALGKFGDLLMAVSKDPAMLQFLNNQQNRKNAPNENFAREVMELFTLGRGNYTETDIKNAARAFTGWGFTPEGEFVFREKQHDSEAKTFMGKTGNFSGEDVLGLILENPQTARFLTTKIYTYFVNEKPDKRIVEGLADRFYKSGYDIAALMREIFESDWFYAPENTGNLIKSPIELLADWQSSFGLTFGQDQGWIFMEKLLGQVLFYPPNVAGWPGGKNWIDSSSLMFRLKMPEVIFQSAEVAVEAKDEGDVNTAYLSKKNSKNFNASVNWEPLLTVLKDVQEPQLLDQLSEYLLQNKLTTAQKALLQKRASSASKEQLIKSLTMAMLSLPEYQLC